MLRKLFVFVVCLMATITTACVQTPPYNEIWYTTTGGRTISFNDDDLVSNSYNNGRGVLKFRNSVTSIGRYAFEGCSSLTSITIPNSVTSIGEGAFEGCSSLESFAGKFASEDGRCLIKDGELIAFAPSELTSYTIPNSVTSIGRKAFEGCSGLKSLKGKFTSSDGRCLIKDGELIAFAPAGLTSYTIPNSVTSIEDYAFSGCSSLTSITIPNSVTSIGAFYGCDALKDVNVNITNLAKYCKGNAIYNIPGNKHLYIDNKEITELVIPNNVTSIGDQAFRGCSSLKSITIPNSVTEIGWHAFSGCSSLTNITIPESVTSIGSCAFFDCSSLKSITIPNSVTSIGDDAFLGCSSLKSITIPNSVTEIGGDAFSGCSSLTSITIPYSVTGIGHGAFEGCSSLTSITIPDSVTEIGCSAFNGCSSLISITIPNSVTSIEEYTFYDCSSLTSITIPNSVTWIGEGAFYGCDSLTSITCLATTPHAIDDLMIGETTMIYVPKKAVKAYKQDPEWSRYEKQIKQIK